jgi:N-acetyl sugar amidotransferase
MKICVKCIVNETVPGVVFDLNGVCNLCCNDVKKSGNYNLYKNNNDLAKFIKRIKSKRKGDNDYDCLIGVSGGVDSSYTLVKCVENGLKPLVVHMDNGWNSELAVSNINNLIDKLEVDLITVVLDWDEYKSMMNAFFSSDVVDVELLYDNAMLKVNYETARKYNIKNIIFGTNHSTEGIEIPDDWAWNKNDGKNIKSICSKHGVEIKKFPLFNVLDLVIYKYLYGIKNSSILDVLQYNKSEAIEYLSDKYDFKPYPYKHYESIFTRFYQGYILPGKFNIDKRIIHLSSLISSGQLTRGMAISELLKPPYGSEQQLINDRNYFLKKLDWTEEQLENYLSRPEVKHDKYGSDLFLYKILIYFYNFFSKKNN